MAIDKKRRQKQLAKKAAARKLHHAQLQKQPHKYSAMKAAQFPVGECFLPNSLFDSGIGVVVLTRKTPDGSIAVANFLIDAFCLGCKDAMYGVFTPTDFAKYLQQIKQGSDYESIHHCCLRKLVEGAVAYARNLGFAPHSDYAVVAQMFGDIDATACPVSYTYGQDGKPFYISGPNDSPARSRKILETLARNFDPDNYDFLVDIGAVDESQSKQQSSKTTQSLRYHVVEDGIKDPVYDQLPQAVKDELEELYNHTLRTHPEQAIDILKPILEKHPNVPKIYNFLHICYKVTGNRAAAKRILNVMVHQFPDYLFGKLGQIEECLESGRLDEIPRILDGKYDLKLLYPHRNEFHISEFLGFSTMMAWYFHEVGDLEQAKNYYESLRKIAPNDERTKFIQQKLFPASSSSTLSSFLNKLMPWHKR